MPCHEGAGEGGLGGNGKECAWIEHGHGSAGKERSCEGNRSSRRMGGASVIRAQFHSDQDALARLREPWMELFDDAPTASLYQSWEWTSAWWRHYRGRLHPCIATLHEGDDLVGLMPMTVTSWLFRALKPMGKGPSCFLHPLARRGHEEAVARSLYEAIAGSKQFDYIDLSMIRDTEPIVAQFPKSEVYAQHPCHAIRLPATFEEYAKDLPRKFRQKLRHFERKDWRYEGAELHVLGPGEIDRGMDLLFDYSNRRWEGRTSSVAFQERRMRDLYREWAHAATARGWLRLITLDLDGASIAVLLAARIKKTCYFQMQGFQPECHALSPGTMLTADTVRWSIEEGCEHFEFMIGDEGYKQLWAPNHTHQLVGWRHVGPGLRGRMARAAYRTGVWAKSQKGRLVSRLRGRRPSARTDGPSSQEEGEKGGA